MKKLIYISALLLVAVGKTQAQDDKSISGAGSSFDNPLFSKMFYEYDKAKGVKVNYQSIGSGAGISKLIDKVIDFGASDAVMNKSQDSAAGGAVIHIPVTAGAVVICYNLPDVKGQINLTGDLIAEIFRGRITKWNDKRITSINKGITLPSYDIMVVHRSDGSGTTSIFTTYLTKVSDGWNTKVGKGSSVNWPAGQGGKGNEGVAGLVKQTPGAIGYIELAYAIQNHISYAKVQNKVGKFINPSVASTTDAANIDIPEDGKVSLTNTESTNGYPISGFSWVLIYKEMKYNGRSAAKASEMVNLIWWMIHDGQQYSAALNYAPLPKAAVKVGEKLLKTATYDHKKIMK